MTYKIYRMLEQDQIIYAIFKNGVDTGEFFFEERDAKDRIKFLEKVDKL